MIRTIIEIKGDFDWQAILDYKFALEATTLIAPEILVRFNHSAWRFLLTQKLRTGDYIYADKPQGAIVNNHAVFGLPYEVWNEDFTCLLRSTITA